MCSLSQCSGIQLPLSVCVCVCVGVGVGVGVGVQWACVSLQVQSPCEFPGSGDEAKQEVSEEVD